MKLNHSLRKTQGLLAAVLLLITLCFAGVHEASADHFDKHSHQSCLICLGIQSLHSTDLTPPVVLPSPVIGEAVPYFFPDSTQNCIPQIFQIAAPPRAPPFK